MKVHEPRAMLALLVFEAADCLMALPASEVARLETEGKPLFSPEAGDVSADSGQATVRIDLNEYFTGEASDGPWLRWGRGDMRAWLRIRCVVEVVSCPLGALTPMPALLRAKQDTEVFLAAGIRGDDVFLLLDPARLRASRVGAAGPTSATSLAEASPASAATLAGAGSIS
jgi:hypothetical protein